MTYLQWLRATLKKDKARFETLRAKVTSDLKTAVLGLELFEAKYVYGRIDATDALKTRASCSKEHLKNVRFLLDHRKEYLGWIQDRFTDKRDAKAWIKSDLLEIHMVRGAIELFSEAEAFLVVLEKKKEKRS